MATSPAIIPLSIPMMVGFFRKKMSMIIQVSSAVAVQRCVLSTAAEASALAKYGSPPLNPLQPSQSRPPPAMASMMLLGALCCRSFSRRGPSTAGRNEGRDRGGDVDDVATAVVDRAERRRASRRPRC